MRILVKAIIAWLVAGAVLSAAAQPKTQGIGLEGIIVETYYLADAMSGGSSGALNLPEGTITYRIFVDLKPGYSLQALYGAPGHPLKFQTSSYFYNHPDFGAVTGDLIHQKLLNQPGVALDSWLTIGAASLDHLGVLLEDDSDGSVLSYDRFVDKDGIMKSDIPQVFGYNLDMQPFDAEGIQQSKFFADNAALAVLSGFGDKTPGNRILVAQLTTDGQLSFEMNIQVGKSDCGEVENYVARNPAENEIQHPDLVYP